MPRILLLVPNATYRAEAFVRAARKLPYDITIASETPSSLSNLLPDDLIGMAFGDYDSCVRDVRELAKRQDIKAIVPVDDQVTVLAALLSQALELPGNPPDAVRATRNKLLMRKLLESGGVDQPRYVEMEAGLEPSAAAARLGFPVVVKPLSLSASRGVTRANNETELAQGVRWIRNILADEPGAITEPDFLIETYAPGWEVAVEGIVTAGDLEILAIFDKPDPLEGPQFPESIYITPSRLPRSEQQSIAQLTQRALRAIGISHGPIHAEVRGHEGHLWFIEVAARSIGGYCSQVLRFAGGQSLEELIVRHALSPYAQLPAREPGAAGVLMMQAPEAGRFVRMRGADTVRAMPGVEKVIVSAHRGQTVKPLPEGFLYVGFVFAEGATPEVVEATLRSARDTLVPVIEP